MKPIEIIIVFVLAAIIAADNLWFQGIMTMFLIGLVLRYHKAINARNNP